MRLMLDWRIFQVKMKFGRRCGAMHWSKALGPDGLQGAFYKRFWDIVGDSLMAFVWEFFSNGKLLKAMNFAHVVLISKTGGPRPIPSTNFGLSVFVILASRW